MLLQHSEKHGFAWCFGELAMRQYCDTPTSGVLIRWAKRFRGNTYIFLLLNPRKIYTSKELESINNQNPSEAPIVHVPNQSGLAYSTPWGYLAVECVEIEIMRYMFRTLRNLLGLAEDYKFDVVLTHPGKPFP